MNLHSDFILKSISGILREAEYATSSLPVSIETYPISEYVMQSIFLRMTGFQEQKTKCLAWELASFDYAYRYRKFNSAREHLGECSSYEEKNSIFNDLVNIIRQYKPTFDINTYINKQSIIDATKSDIDAFFTNSKLKGWMQFDYNTYKDLYAGICDNCLLMLGNSVGYFCNCDNCPKGEKKKNSIVVNPRTCVLPVGLKSIYQRVWEHRNRSAHNTTSYQQNLPSFTTLQSPEYQLDNYFMRFAVLILIDKITVECYKEFLKLEKLF